MNQDPSAPARRGLIPPQQRRSEATLSRIRQGALALLATRELSALSMEEIAAAAGVSVGAIYRRFKSRQDLMEDLLHDLQVRQLASLDELLAPDLWRGTKLATRLEWIVERQREAAAQAPGFIRALFTEVLAAEQAADDDAVRLNARAGERLARWLLECGSEIGAADPENTARVVVAQLSISLHLAHLYPSAFAPLSADQVTPILKATALAALRGT